MKWIERESKHVKNIDHYLAMCKSELERRCVKHFVYTGEYPFEFKELCKNYNVHVHERANRICDLIRIKNTIPHARKYINRCYNAQQKEMLKLWLRNGRIPHSDNPIDNAVVESVINFAKSQGFNPK